MVSVHIQVAVEPAKTAYWSDTQTRALILCTLRIRIRPWCIRWLSVPAGMETVCARHAVGGHMPT